MYGLLLTITKYSYIGIFAALGLNILGIPIPDETLMAFVGREHGWIYRSLQYNFNRWSCLHSWRYFFLKLFHRFQY
jgi:membrane protein DedA with SNARE-associated domain